MKLHSIDIDSSKMARKLRAIASHAEQLAKELEAIENEWQCDCGSFDYSDHAYPTGNLVKRICNKCKESYVVLNEAAHEGDG